MISESRVLIAAAVVYKYGIKIHFKDYSLVFIFKFSVLTKRKLLLKVFLRLLNYYSLNLYG